MKVSLVAPQDIAIVVGGLRTQIMETARHLPDYQVEVDFFDSWSTYDQEKVDLFHLFAANAASYHTANTLHNAGLPYVISPVMYSNHKPLFIKFSRQLESWSKKVFSGIWTDYSIMSESCRMSRYVLPNTRAEAELIEKGFNISPEKIEVIPNGVEKKFLYADSTLFYNHFGIDNFVLFVGTIGSKRKNVLRLVRVLADLELPAVFIGNTMDNEEGRTCREIIGSRPSMHLLEPMDHDDPLLASAYAASKVFVMPSYYETPSISAMEAALAGSAIAITKYGGTREYFKEYGHYLEPESLDSIRNAVQSAWNSTTNDSLKNHIAEHYTWPRIAEQTVNIYKRILAG